MYLVYNFNKFGRHLQKQQQYQAIDRQQQYNLNKMSTDFDEISRSITQQQKRIQQNQQQRNAKFNQCLSQYLNHLQQQTHRLDSTEIQNDARNQMISSTFQNVYERIMVASQVGLRKVKETCYQKMVFWDKLIENNAHLNDLELKKDLYLQKRDAKDRYQEAIQSQKVKKIPYNLLLGKLKQKQSLKQFQAKNKQLEQQVVKGTKTLKQWNITQDRKPTNNFRDYEQGGNNFLNQFATQPQTGSGWTRAPLKVSRYDGNDDLQILKNFQYRR